MNGENRPLVADELVEVEKQLVQVHQDFRIITDRFRRIDGIHLKLIKTNKRSQPVSEEIFGHIRSRI
jgi:hypothetical protein